MNIRKSYAIFNCHKNKLFDSLQLNLLEIQSSRFDFSWNFHQMCENYHFPFGSKILSCRHTICMRKMIFKSICWKIVSEIMSIYRKHLLVNAKSYHIEPRTAILITVYILKSGDSNVPRTFDSSIFLSLFPSRSGRIFVQWLIILVGDAPTIHHILNELSRMISEHESPESLHILSFFRPR